MTDEEYLAMTTGSGDGYLPASDFLRNIYAEEVVLDETEFGDANRAMLLRCTRDPDVSNRDWAMMLLNHHGGDGEQVREAFRRGLEDPVYIIRLEALIGLSRRDRAGALPFVTAMLGGETIDNMALEAAANVARPELLDVLNEIRAGWVGKDKDEDVIRWLNVAIKHCSSAVPHDPH